MNSTAPLERLVAGDPYLRFLRASFADSDAVAAGTALAQLGEPKLLERLAGDKLDAALEDRLNGLPPLLSTETIAILRRRRRNYLALNVLRRAEAEEVLSAFTNSGIPAVGLKGIDLAWRAYPDPSLRPFTDVDLLISPAHLDAAEKIMAELNYHPAPETVALRKSGEAWVDYQYEHAETGLLFELHVELLHHGRFRFDPALALRRSVGGFLHPDDRFLHLALHLSKHSYFDRLLWVYDLAVLAPDAPAPETLAAAARATGCGGAVWLALALSRVLFGARLAEHEAALSPPLLRAQALTRTLAAYARGRGRISARLLHFQLFDRMGEAARYSMNRSMRKLSGRKAGW